MKINLFLTAAAVIALVSSSCTSGGDDNPYSGPRDVTIRIRQEGAQPNVRALGPAIEDGTPVVFQSGLLLFTDANDLVTRIVEVKKGTSAYNGTSVGAVDLEAGVTMGGIPGISTKAAFIGNPSAALKSKANVLGVDIKTLLVNLESQYIVGGGVQNVTLFGEGPLKAAEGGVNKFEALVPVVPVASRFELGRFVGTPNEPGGTFTFELRGIFMDRICNMMHVNGLVYQGGSGNPYIINGGLISRYVENSTISESGYSAAMKGITYDSFAEGEFPTSHSISPNVWAYNVLVPTDTALIPGIVVVIDNIVVNGEPQPGPQYMTIGKFTHKVNGVTTPVKKLQQGKVYALPLIRFTEKNLAEKPFVTDKEVVIEIELKDWERIELGYDFI
jgi:hypothetical protein